MCNLDYLLVSYSHFGIPTNKVLRSLELFATKVMPWFTSKEVEKETRAPVAAS